MSVRFEWDSEKAARNLKKHAVSFDEAMTVFEDPLARIFDDPDHSEGEHREIIVGRSVKDQLLFVSFSEGIEDVIRIVSARRLTRSERKDYEKTNFE
jgi:uncharacterized DUF497 family protein